MIKEPEEILNIGTNSDVDLFESRMNYLLVGQDRAIRTFSRTYQLALAGLHSLNRPLGTLLFLGPTGVGKTASVEAAADAWFSNPDGFIKVDCGEMQYGHEIAKLVGSPPGYLGHKETQPMITQEKLGQFSHEKAPLSLILFDEIEKANDSLFQLLLGILDRARMTLGDNREVDFSRTVVVMTSNLGAREISELVGGGIGFVRSRDEDNPEIDKKIYKIAKEAAKRKFSPEFFNRITKLIVFRRLKTEHYKRILDIELTKLQDIITRTVNEERKFVFRCTDAAKDFLLEKGIDRKYGARPLGRTIEKYLTVPFSNLILSGQVHTGNLILADYIIGADELIFKRGSVIVGDSDENGWSDLKRQIQLYSKSDDGPEEASAKKAKNATR
ncbi:MAG: ATP-dependent Clp protease ATP-binding subunit [Parcubacteria group bacterium]|nr:ATP-dependent Clp protease ATP-binding subunit [Parcubacteria group bacterium]